MKIIITQQNHNHNPLGWIILYFITTLASTIVINKMTTVEGHKLMFDEKIHAEFDKWKEKTPECWQEHSMRALSKG